ncbi:hypothetical protein YIM730264_12200 [Thermus hydrothermalis]
MPKGAKTKTATNPARRGRARLGEKRLRPSTPTPYWPRMACRQKVRKRKRSCGSRFLRISWETGMA